MRKKVKKNSLLYRYHPKEHFISCILV